MSLASEPIAISIFTILFGLGLRLWAKIRALASAHDELKSEHDDMKKKLGG